SARPGAKLVRYRNPTPGDASNTTPEIKSMTRLSAFLLLLPAAFAQPRTRTGEYALILADAPVAQIAHTRAGLSGAPATAHRRKVELAQDRVMLELDRRNVKVHRASSLLVNAVWVEAAGTNAADLASIPGVRRVQYLPLVKPALTTALGLVNATTA